MAGNGLSAIGSAPSSTQENQAMWLPRLQQGFAALDDLQATELQIQLILSAIERGDVHPEGPRDVTATNVPSAPRVATIGGQPGNENVVARPTMGDLVVRKHVSESSVNVNVSEATQAHGETSSAADAPYARKAPIRMSNRFSLLKPETFI
ncbi:hypothetical protein BDW22DRAFT_1352676 [Trametopsis cervina]|nr:hypothetical protein BDW22DRAFT_1352676 [Trametopsis cervina]